MDFNKHFDLINKHAFLSASNYHWINYDFPKLESVYQKSKANERGIKLHNFAMQCIKLSIKLPPTKTALNMYVNDAIGYKMHPEQILFYSYNAFGTADAISFRNNFLRIHDLKTGYTRVYMQQLQIYAALFCLEYDYTPKNIDIELRIYQATSILIEEPAPSLIKRIMEKIIIFDKKIEDLKIKEQNPWA